MSNIGIQIGLNEANVLSTTLRRNHIYFDDFYYIDSGSEDNSQVIANELDIKCVVIDKVSAAYARNWAIQNINFNEDDILFFIDADVILGTTFVKDVSNTINNRDFDIVFGVKHDISDTGYLLKTKPRECINPPFLGGNFAITGNSIIKNSLKFKSDMRIEEERFFLFDIYSKGLNVIQIDSFHGYHLNYKTSDTERNRSNHSIKFFWILYFRSFVNIRAHLKIFMTWDLIILFFSAGFFNLYFFLFLIFPILTFLNMHQLGSLRNLFLWKLK